MRLPSPRFLIGLVLVLVACLGVAYVVTRSGAKQAQNGGPSAAPATITCIGGSEKTELMADARIKTILRDRYGLTVTFSPLGSYDQVQLSTDELRKRKADCLWPSSASAQSVFESLHTGAFADYRSENLLQSPEVIYAGPQGTDALVKAGLVQERDRRYYIVNVKNLLLDYVLKRRTWESVKAADLKGPISIASTDAAKSNSGFTLAQLELNIIATADVFSAPSADQARKALGTLRALYDAQGLQARSSEAGFRQWLTQGGELHAPLYAGYENQFIQQVTAAGGNSAALLKSVRLLYPEPTIYSDHPLLALSPSAGRFIDAMKDPEIQAIAWKTYGFRSGTQVGVNNVSDFPDLPLADQFRTTTPPNAEVTLMLLSCVKDAKTC